MLAYSAKRFLLSLAIVTLAIALLFCMIYVIPGDPVKIALGPRATPEIVESFRIKMGLDKPLWEQFARFYWLAAQGDLGTDILTGRGVGQAVMEQMPFTLTLIAFSIGWSVLLGVPLGCLAAIKRGSIADRIAGFMSVAMIAVPSFVVAIYALLIFAVSLGWFPAIGAGDRGDFWDQFVHLVLPSFAIGVGWVGYLARLVRASMLEIMGENHVRTARAFGLPERRIVFRYALKLAILPTITILGIGVGHMLSGAVFTEIVFARPGVGKLVYDAINTRNFPMITGAVLVTTAFYVFTMMLSDLLVASLDPRVRTSLR